MNLPGHSDGRICVAPEASGRVWEGGGTEEQGVPATGGGKQEAETNMEERRYFRSSSALLYRSPMYLL